jgi:hypothetical protein
MALVDSGLGWLKAREPGGRVSAAGLKDRLSIGGWRDMLFSGAERLYWLKGRPSLRQIPELLLQGLKRPRRVAYRSPPPTAKGK